MPSDLYTFLLLLHSYKAPLKEKLESYMKDYAADTREERSRWPLRAHKSLLKQQPMTPNRHVLEVRQINQAIKTLYRSFR